MTRLPPFTALAAMLLASAGCTAPSSGVGRLAPRAAEAIDPRVPIPSAEVAGPASPALAAELQRLTANARSTSGAFASAAAEARAAASAAGPSSSESWIAAQQLLSALVAVRAPVTAALGDIDALAAKGVEEHGGLPPGDRLAIAAAAAEVGAIDTAQADTIAAIAASLAR